MLHLRTRPETPSGEPQDRSAESTAARQPLPRCVTEQVRTSTDVLAALLDVEGRSRASIDDLEWADAVAARILARTADTAGTRRCRCGSLRRGR